MSYLLNSKLLADTMKRNKLLVARMLSAALLLFSISVVCLAQEQPLHIKYWLGMSRPVSHLFEVTIEVELPSDPKLRSLDFQMPKWSPGRYAVFDFAKNVQEVKAREACPAGLDCTMPDSQVTRVDDPPTRRRLDRKIDWILFVIHEIHKDAAAIEVRVARIKL